jgi:hypothetical protein
VPVSLIGTFAVLLALGYSANTVSLLALVLAIGIVVDDAIVVVENVERVMEEEPDLTPAEATKKAMRRSPAPIIAITLVLLSVFVPIAFIPASGTAVPPVRGHDQRRDGDLGDQRADPVAGAVRVFLRHTGPRRGIMGACSRGIDCVRDGYAGIVRRLVRVARCRWCWWLVFAASASIGVSPHDADRASCPRRTRARSSSPCNCPTAPRSRAPARWCKQVERC